MARQLVWHRDFSNVWNSLQANVWQSKSLTEDYPPGTTLTRVNLSYQITDSSVDALSKLNTPRGILFDLQWFAGDQPNPLPFGTVGQGFDRTLLWLEQVTGWHHFEIHSPTGGETVIYREAGHQDLNIESQRKSEAVVSEPQSLWLRWSRNDQGGGTPDTFIHVDWSLSALFLLG